MPLPLPDTRPVACDDPGVYRTLLESTRAIPWRIDWASMRFTYIGPQIEELLGWTPSSWLSVNDWADRIHEDDRQQTVDFCVAQSQKGVDHEADYRALTRDGDQVWIRDVVHVVRRADGSVDSLVGFMFDITARKQAEDKILQLQRELEVLSYRDSLTGVANRRMFDTLYPVEWEKARASGEPLSLVVIDIDYFKQYNDHYGHVQGDECLRRVAQAMDAGASGPQELCARLGGEEFVLMLPATDADAARTVAERCRKLLRQQELPHARSGTGRTVTVSMGAGTIVPGAQDDALVFLDRIDRRLYQAKSAGRDRICDTET
ncbi:sensor domain-containing diguanylate cyclase [Massilia yuzhufengensis]|uniref:diguanylate cyclase n=1 Tax=Massilia yuzhufengensis TaxID=1164594 RepID=A0A1I1VAQ7_9BURK|nr:sensor domain-containing diguanylate cyclase [Massilia yuzhufengensis]SFD80092.1 PAS domain S-box-containing protein/diguanylate cyclase (GGDEF) domain-containing protein [Massilia yuzhufengensis]